MVCMMERGEVVSQRWEDGGGRDWENQLPTYGSNNVILKPEDLAFFEDEPPPSPGLYKLACKGNSAIFISHNFDLSRHVSTKVWRFHVAN